MPNEHSTLTSLFSDIADSIRAKTGSQETIVADTFPDAIDAIPTGITPTGTINISSNGDFDVTNYASAAVDVQISADIATESSCIVLPSTGNGVTLQTLSVTQNGTYSAPSGVAYDEVDVSVSGGGTAALDDFVQNGYTGVFSSSNVTSLRDYVFYYCSGLTGVNLPNCTSYGKRCFAYSGITSITFKTGDTFIGGSTGFQFQGCSRLQSITLPSDITSIPGSFCESCTSLTQVVFPSTVTNINSSAFYKCTSCLLFDFRAASAVPTLANKNAFGSMNANAKIVVPDSLYSTWITTANWSDSSIVGHIISASDYANL